MRTGITNLPLHSGRAPRWLTERMAKLAREISTVILSEFGPDEFLRRLSDPFWYQSFGCVLGFDWHSSGLTATTNAALKEGLRGLEKSLGFFVTGGKRISQKTPEEIQNKIRFLKLNLSPQKLIYASRMSAKVDSAGLQDGFQIYQHVFFFTHRGRWAVVQQGLRAFGPTEKAPDPWTGGWARRYHWLSNDVKNFVEEPESAIITSAKTRPLNMVAKSSVHARRTSTFIAGFNPSKTILTLAEAKKFTLPSHHPIYKEDFNPERLKKALLKSYIVSPQNFEELLNIRGIGPKTIRALALISELIYDKSASFQDPARFSFAHGGKDGYPYPVDRQTYDQSIQILEKGIRQSQLGIGEKNQALKRLFTQM